MGLKSVLDVGHSYIVKGQHRNKGTVGTKVNESQKHKNRWEGERNVDFIEH